MNENDQTNSPPIAVEPEPVFLGPPLPPATAKPFSWWLQKVFACNPFYPISAALLLYGCYRVSLDAPLLNLETARLLFNFSSVQIYEVLLVFTAIFLARRRLWYDSTLLVGLENLLVFVPFIFISLAALIDSGMALTMSLAGAAVTTLRFGSLKKFFTELNLPGRVLKIGAAFLAFNVALPLLYRHFGETKVSIHIAAGPAYVMNEFSWLLILPVVLALANVLPRAGAGGDLPPQHRWLPTGMFTLWLAVSVTHLLALDYIYQFQFRGELFAPFFWVLAWTAWRRLAGNNFLPRHALLIPPALTPLFAFAPSGHKTFFILVGLNLAAYLAVSLRDRQNYFARHLLAGSALLLAAGLPEAWQQFIAPGRLPAHWVAAGLTAYLLLYATCSRNPKLAMLGGIITSGMVLALFGNHAGAIHWALQGGFVFFLLHSLRWNDAAHPGAKLVRGVAVAMWVLHALAWVAADTGEGWMTLVTGTLVLGIYGARKIFFGQAGQLIVPLAALLVMFTGPCEMIVIHLRTMPTGLLAVVASFFLFGLGTVAALTRRHWHK